MLKLSSLNPQQRRAVEKIKGPIVILAGAGTGKTGVITCRIAHMVLNHGISPDSIVAVTFTNKAAREMRERVTLLAPKESKRLIIGTFHSFCLKVLRKHHVDCGLVKNFALASSGDQIDLVRRSLDDLGWAGLYEAPLLLSKISHCKNHLVRPQDFKNQDLVIPGVLPNEQKVLSFVYELYQRQLRLNRVIDFDDCILEFINLLESREDIRSQLEAQFQYLLVDEFQDTNHSQLRALELIGVGHKNVCVVGDDDQSIYSWRGAEPKIIEIFEQKFTGAELIKLEQNYRCTNVILNAANHVIARNLQRKPKALWSQSKDSTAIVLSKHPNEIEEARWIAKKCLSHLGKGGKLSDIGIIYRTNSQAKSIEMGLREAGLVYQVFGGNSMFEKKEVKDFLAYLKCSFSPEHRLSYWRIINTPPRGIGIKTQELIESHAIKSKQSPVEAGQSVSEQLPKNSRDSLFQLNSKLTNLAKEPITTPEALKQRGLDIIASFKLEQHIRQHAKNDASRIRKIEGLKRICDYLESMAKSMIEEEGRLNPDALLDQLLLSDDSRLENKESAIPKIALMTIHGSKGLEFPVVFLPGLEDDLLPHKNSESLQSIAEERRLFYVAITRAKTNLFMSYARSRSTGFQSTAKKPSRFLKELPEEGLIWEGDTNPEASQEEQKTNKIKRLSGLRDRIKTGFKDQSPPGS